MENSVMVEMDAERAFFRVKPTGVLTDDLLTQCSQRARALPEFQAGMAVLLDLRAITGLEVTTDKVVGFAQAAQKDVNRMAILAPQPAAFGMARMYEIISDLSENRVGVYSDEQSALNWLGV